MPDFPGRSAAKARDALITCYYGPRVGLRFCTVGRG
ncbi:uncharacterized protein METZ01_LOCUS96707, partial [marine metagenome]